MSCLQSKSNRLRCFLSKLKKNFSSIIFYENIFIANICLKMSMSDFEHLKNFSFPNTSFIKMQLFKSLDKKTYFYLIEQCHLIQLYTLPYKIVG